MISSLNSVLLSARWKEEESLKGVAIHIFVFSVFDLNYKNIYG
jgi:hypothetical protein